MSTIAITTGNFNAKLASFKKSSLSIRDNAQELIVFGLNQYREHGDAGYLSRLIAAANEVKSLPSRTLKEYIKAHANLMYTKGPDKIERFAKVSKSAPIEVTMPEVTWYNWEGNNTNQATADFNITQQLKALMGRYKKAVEEGKQIKDEGIETVMSELVNVLKLEEVETPVQQAA